MSTQDPEEKVGNGPLLLKSFTRMTLRQTCKATAEFVSEEGLVAAPEIRNMLSAFSLEMNTATES